MELRLEQNRPKHFFTAFPHSVSILVGRKRPIINSSVQPLSRVRLFATPWTVACQASLSITNSFGVYPNSCPLSLWCQPTISSSVIPFSSRPQSFLAWGSFQKSQLLASGGQSIGASASTTVLPKNTQDWSLLGWTGWISLHSKGLSRVFSKESSPHFKSIKFYALSFLYSPTLTTIHDYWRTIALTRWTFVDKVMSLLFYVMSRLVITFKE